MKGAMAFAVIMIVISASLRGVDVPVSFIPARFSVGDSVEMRYEFSDPGPDKTVIVGDTDEFPDLGYVEVMEVRQVRRKNVTLNSCVFIPWAPGEIKIASFSVSGIYFPERIVTVFSVMGDKPKATQPSRQPELLRGTMAVVGTIAVVFFAFVLFVVLSVTWFVPFMKRIAVVRALREPAKVFERSLRRLARRALKSDAREFYNSLSKSARQFFTATVDTSFSSLTSREISRRTESLFQDFSDSEGIAGFFIKADLIRFGFCPADTIMMETDIAFFLGIAVQGAKS